MDHLYDGFLNIQSVHFVKLLTQIIIQLITIRYQDISKLLLKDEKKKVVVALFH